MLASTIHIYHSKFNHSIFSHINRWLRVFGKKFEFKIICSGYTWCNYSQSLLSHRYILVARSKKVENNIFSYILLLV